MSDPIHNSYKRLRPVPEVRRRGRGPRHRRPFLLRVTALFHLAVRILFVAAILGVPVALLHFNNPWVVVGILAALVPSIVIWVILAAKIGCRVCGMRMFFSKNCVKSRKAPSIPGLGPHNTMAFLALFASEVRCPYCGTPNDLGSRGHPEDY